MGEYELIITHLCVGQGLCVLLDMQYHDIQNKEKHFVGLLDCGSTSGGEVFYGRALEKISDAVNVNDGVLNYVHISHLDLDHYNLLSKLGENYKKEYNEKIKVEKFVFGCTGGKTIKKIEETRTELSDCFDVSNGFIYFNNGTQLLRGRYKDLPDEKEYQKICVQIPLGDNIFFKIVPILYRKQYSAGCARDLEDVNTNYKIGNINAGSSVIITSIFYRTEAGTKVKASYIFTGDATVETMKIIQKIQKTQKNKLFGGEYKLLQISHHGTRKYVADCEKSNDFTTLKGFLGEIQPNAAVVSAKCTQKGGWLHPHRETMEVYEKSVEVCEIKGRNITSFMQDKNEKIVQQKKTDKNLYETFKLDANEVEDNMIYSECSQNQYLLYDIRTVIKSGEDHVSIKEVKR